MCKYLFLQASLGCISFCRPHWVVFTSAGLIGSYFHLQASLGCISICRPHLVYFHLQASLGLFPSADLIRLYFHIYMPHLGVFPSAGLTGLYFHLQASLGCISICKPHCVVFPYIHASLGCISICRPQCVLFPSAGLIGLYFHLQASLGYISVYTCLIGVYFHLQTWLSCISLCRPHWVVFPYIYTSLGCISICRPHLVVLSIFIQFPVLDFLGHASELSSLPMNSRNRVALKTYHQLIRFVGNPVSITFEECRQNSATKTLNPFHTQCRRTVSPSEHIPQRRGPRLVQVVRTWQLTAVTSGRPMQAASCRCWRSSCTSHEAGVRSIIAEGDVWLRCGRDGCFCHNYVTSRSCERF